MNFSELKFKSWNFFWEFSKFVTKWSGKLKLCFKRCVREGELWFCSAVMPQKDFISACKCIILSCLLQYNAEHTTSDIILVPFIAVVKFRPPHISRSCKKERELKHHRNFSNPNSTLKITEKVSFNIASEASYVYILKKCQKKGQFWRVF